ncbi:MAG TPA: outer membrane lipoprotein-sorting protein, partial [Polyangiaceae bacterium]|nr:outer membrane lipoprotein-sorting protein [Polyangiaceae bacterium]
YSDLQRKDDKDAKNTRLADENIGSESTYVLESKAGSSSATYGKIKTWIRKTDFIPLRTQFFDGDGKLAKTLYVRRTQDIEGKPAVVEALMKSASGHSTELVVDSVKPSKDLPDAAFSPLTLDR